MGQYGGNNSGFGEGEGALVLTLMLDVSMGLEGGSWREGCLGRHLSVALPCTESSAICRGFVATTSHLVHARTRRSKIQAYTEACEFSFFCYIIDELGTFSLPSHINYHYSHLYLARSSQKPSNTLHEW